MKKVFLDSDVIIDFLTNRLPFSIAAKQVFYFGKEKKIALYTSAIVLSNIFYIVSKMENEKQALQKINDLLTLLQITTTSQSTVNEAKNSKFTDFEDALQNFSAIEFDIQILCTRNIKDYKNSSIAILTPNELVVSVEATLIDH